MSVVVPVRSINAVSNSADPKQAIMDIVGPKLADIDVMFNRILVATFIRSEKTIGGIIRPGMNIQEDVWQGKVGLVLKLGQNAFEDDAETSFGGQEVEVGDWVVYKVGDAWALQINDYPCRVVKDSGVILKVKDPSVIL